MKNIFIFALAIISFGLVAAVYFSWNAADTPQEAIPSNAEARLDEQALGQIEADSAENETTIAQEIEVESLEHSIDEPDSLWVVINKDRPISEDYVPENLVDVDVVKLTEKSASELQLRGDAAVALELLFDAAADDDYSLLMNSAYRSAELQAFYYNNYVEAYGQKEADTFSARPGTSEHQIGLSADIHGASRDCYLSTCFGETDEGIWLAENAHIFGYVIRYPEGKEAITTYQYEPWHFRYVGTELASELFESQATLEEYFGLEG